MASNESSSVPARLTSLKEIVKERFPRAVLGFLGLKQQKVLLEDEQEVFLQVGRTVWHAPRQLRIELWLSSLARRHSLVSEYQTYLAQDIAREAATDIEKDVQRTFPNTRRFHAEEGQAQLRNVLRAYAAYDPEVAYCQGMNFLTGLLLMYLPSEAHAFAALVVLMEDRKLRSFYHRSMALLQVQLWQLSRLIAPSLNQHLEALGVVPMLYGASWLMTAFSADFPIPFSARIMDVLLADQCECALLKVATAVMKSVESRLLEMHDLENVLTHLKIEVPAWEEEDLHAVLTAAFTKPWTSRQLVVLRSTEGAETVAQAMDRVMTMNEQLSAPAADVVDEDDGGGDDGDVADARVAVTIPRLQPPPQPFNSFTASPACGTPVNGGMFGTGSYGGAGSSPPHAAVAAAATKCGSFGPGSATVSGGGAATSGGGGPVLLGPAGPCAAVAAGGGSAGGSTAAVWGIPCIHPNAPASPAIQAFRRAHLPCFQAAAAVGAAAAVARSSNLQPHALHPDPRTRLSSSGSASGEPSHATASELATGGSHDAEDPSGGCGGGDGPDGCEVHGEEWGDFNTAAVRQKWRNILRAAPGSSRHVLLHPTEDDAGVRTGAASGLGSGPWQGSASTGGAVGCLSAGGALPDHSSLGPALCRESHSFTGPSQPIPVPGSSGGGGRSGSTTAGGIASAFANSAVAAAATGRPPLPPRASSLERGPAALGPFSRLSVVAEDPLAVQMGPAAPAPSPRGSMDLRVLGRSGSQPIDACEQHGLLLSGPGSLGAAFGVASGVSASINGDCASGTASATTAGPMLSPSGVSGAVSPHAASPKLLASSWRMSNGGSSAPGPGAAGGLACSGGGGGGGGGGGTDTPTVGYVPLGMEHVASDSFYDGVIGSGVEVSEQSVTMAQPLLVPPVLAPPPEQQQQHSSPHCAQSPNDMATDIAGDILRMLSAVDTGNANAAYDPRVVLGESMYADSPNKEKSTLVRGGSEVLRHVPSSSALAEIAAQDLAKAQEVAERVRQELEAQLAQQKAAERGSCAGGPHASVTEVANPAAAPPASEGQASAAAHVPPSAGDAAEGAGSAATAPAAEAAPGAAGGGGGPDELVFRRPTLYVDGIPMFDPKSLMSDSSEAQVMFTPTVSPGANSYADPLHAAFTPTGADAGTPGEAPSDAADDAAAAEPAADGAEAAPSAAPTSPVQAVSTTIPTLGEASVPEQSGEEATAAPSQAVQEDGGAASVARAVGTGADGTAAAAGGTAVQAVAADAADEGLTQLPSASEWVDWSQAPPIQSVTSVVLSVSELAELVAAEYGDNVLAAVPSESVSDSDYDSDIDLDSMDGDIIPEDSGMVVDTAGPAPMAATVSLPSGSAATQGEAEGRQAAEPLVRDLIDMASPARPLQTSSGTPIGPNATPQPAFGTPSISTSTGTGLSPVPAQGASSSPSSSQHYHPHRHHQHHHSRHRSLVLLRRPVPEEGEEEWDAGDGQGLGSITRQIPYGLLPMASSASSYTAPCISFNSATSFASASSNSSVGPAAAAASGNAAGQLSGISLVHRAQRPVPASNASCVEPTPPALEGVSTGSSAFVSASADGCGALTASDLAPPSASEHHPEPEEQPICDAAIMQQVSFAASAPEPRPAPVSEASQALPAPAAESAAPAVSPATASGEGLGVLGGSDAEEDNDRLCGDLLAPGEVEAPAPEEALALRETGSEQAEQHCCALAELQAKGTAEEEEDGVPQEQQQHQQVQDEPPAMEAEASALDLCRSSEPCAEPPKPFVSPFLAASHSEEAPAAAQDDARGGSRTPPAMEPQGSGDAEADGEEVESSPFRAALSPSLAHHIMSAYLRSEQHQQQQEQRELQERLMAEQQQQPTTGEHAEQHPLQGDHHIAAVQPTAGVPGAGEPAASEPVAGHGHAHGHVAGLVTSHDVLGVLGVTGSATEVVILPDMHAVPAGISSGQRPPAPAAAEEVNLCPVAAPPAALSGTVSPEIGSPSRAAAAGLELPPLPVLPPKALTPFAVSMDDPAMSRLSAEVLMAMPPPPPALLLLQPEMPAPPTAPVLSGSGSGPAEGCTAGLAVNLHTAKSVTLAMLRRSGSGERDILGGIAPLAAGTAGGGGGSVPGCALGAAATAAVACGANTARPSAGGSVTQLHQNPHPHPPHSLLHHLAHPQPDAQPLLVLPFGSHDLPVSAGGVGVTTQHSPSEGCHGAAAASTAGNAHPHPAGARGSSCSAGGSMPPLLPPPPPPQVPLSQTAALAAAAAAASRHECASAPTAVLPTATAAVQAPLPPVLYSTSATLVCVQGTSAATSTPAAAVAAGSVVATAATVPPAPPTWTATFDGVDDSPSVAGNGDLPVGQPRTLASAFAAEANQALDTPPSEHANH